MSEYFATAVGVRKAEVPAAPMSPSSAHFSPYIGNWLESPSTFEGVEGPTMRASQHASHNAFRVYGTLRRKLLEQHAKDMAAECPTGCTPAAPARGAYMQELEVVNMLLFTLMRMQELARNTLPRTHSPRDTSGRCAAFASCAAFWASCKTLKR